MAPCLNWLNNSVLLIVAGACLFISCKSQIKSPSMSAQPDSAIFHSDTLPETLSMQLQNRADLLSEGVAFLSFQMISRTPDPSANMRYVLTAEGTMRLDHHSGNVAEYSELPFDREFSEAETKQIPRFKMDALEALLSQPDFFQEAKYQQNAAVEGGSYFVVKVQRDDQSHEVIFDAYESPLVSFLWNLAY